MAVLGDGNNEYTITNPLGEQVNAGKGDDTVTGGLGDDHLNGQQGDDTLYGEGGNDELNGGPGDDILDGGDGDDILIGAEGVDVITGGAGDDIMDGAEGPNQFVFNFEMGAGSQTFHFDTTGIDTQSELSTHYTAFLQQIASQFGFDADQDGSVEVGLGQNGGTPFLEGIASSDVTFGAQETLAIKTGKTTQERTIYTEITVDTGPALTSSDGNDVIRGFNIDGNVDKQDTLVFNITGTGGSSVSLTEADFNSLFTLSLVNNDQELTANDLKLSLGNAWSVTLEDLGDSFVSEAGTINLQAAKAAIYAHIDFIA
ncbi:calcium-binding protein [Microvirga yunnanensis]|uniref:calcium-binding protein n=1 Tax=Microvirga yunnanensis TaxID=2953740 RepID=UPI0021C64A1A|nr:hypothetical protein [Microvirga sp. HBU65207]